jgi:hypothetical protein
MCIFKRRMYTQELVLIKVCLHLKWIAAIDPLRLLVEA